MILCDHDFDVHGGWGVRQSYATLTHLNYLNCSKRGFAAKSCLRSCLGHVNKDTSAWAYPSFHNPGFAPDSHTQMEGELAQIGG